MGRWITDQPLDTTALIAETDDLASGALIIFLGTVRNENDGLPVRGMYYEAHTVLAETVIAQIEQEACTQHGARVCRIQHRIGVLALGEPSVIVVTRAAHRREAYAASRYAIDEVKRRAPIWKEEHYTDGDSRYLEGVPLTPPENDQP